jgi:hypothetical protein
MALGKKAGFTGRFFSSILVHKSVWGGGKKDVVRHELFFIGKACCGGVAG